jgi:hypothetical protein
MRMSAQHGCEVRLRGTIGYWQDHSARFSAAIFTLSAKHLYMGLPRRKQETDAAVEDLSFERPMINDASVEPRSGVRQ